MAKWGKNLGKSLKFKAFRKLRRSNKTLHFSKRAWHMIMSHKKWPN